MSKRIEDIRLAVEVMHNCAAKHECSVPVIEMFGKDEIWEGVVEMFALTGHPNAKRRPVSPTVWQLTRLFSQEKKGQLDGRWTRPTLVRFFPMRLPSRAIKVSRSRAGSQG